MKELKRFRRNFFAVLLVAQLIPLLLVGSIYFSLAKLTDTDAATCAIIGLVVGGAVGAVMLLLLFNIYTAAIGRLYNHVVQIRNNNVEYRTAYHRKGLFGAIAERLNWVSDRMQQYETANKTESDVLLAESQRLRNIINSIKDGIFALDKDGYIVLFNKAAERITGFGVAQAAGKPVSHIVPMMRGNELVLSEWLKTVDGQAFVEQHWENVRLKTENGGQKTVNVDALYQGADPNGIRTLVTFNDRTEAQQVEDMKLDFVALAAHELRTPITVIKGYIEILEDELGNSADAKQKEFFNKLEISANQLSAIINNILHVSRIEHGNLNLKPEPTDWVALIKSVSQNLAKKAQTTNKKILLKTTGTIPQVSVDRMSITEVITNLVDNALKYSPDGTRITISISVNNNMVETSVMDQGAGIPENDLDKLFVKFFRSHHTRGSHAGTGLGLYMCKGIIEAHGGTIWVNSKEGEGSTFGFALPISARVAGNAGSVDNTTKVMKGVHGWIKNHSLYRG